MTRAGPRLPAWERRTEWPLTGLALIFLGIYAFEVLDVHLTRPQHDLIDTLLTGIWVLFGLDYLVRLLLADDRRRYARTHLLDLIVLLLPMARPLRALRMITMIGMLNRRLRGGLQGRVAVYVVATTLLVGLVAALSVLEAERYAPHATITTFGDAIWWTLSTITTVGYGDLYPVTTEGRVVAGSLMVAGIALLGVITGSVATWFVTSLREAEEADEAAEEAADQVSAQLDEVLAELRRLSSQVQSLEHDLTRRTRP